MSDRELRNALRQYNSTPTADAAHALARAYIRSQGVPDGPEEECPDCKNRPIPDNPEYEYWQDVRGTAQGIVDELTPGEDGSEPNVTDREGLDTLIHETIDGSQRVIYTGLAQECLRFSSNDGAYFDEFGPEGACDSSGINWSALAFCAFRQDVIEALESTHGINLSEPFTCPADGCGMRHEDWESSRECCAEEEEEEEETDE